MPAEPCVLVGRDVHVYTAQGYGGECGPAAGATTYNLLGRWRTISFEVELNWADTTSSSAAFVTRRKTTVDFRATLEGLVEMVGSAFLFLSNNNNVVKVVFTESTGGSTLTFMGGITRASYRGQREEFTDTLEVQCVGDIEGSGSVYTYIAGTTTAAEAGPGASSSKKAA